MATRWVSGSVLQHTDSHGSQGVSLSSRVTSKRVKHVSYHPMAERDQSIWLQQITSKINSLDSCLQEFVSRNFGKKHNYHKCLPVSQVVKLTSLTCSRPFFFSNTNMHPLRWQNLRLQPLPWPRLQRKHWAFFFHPIYVTTSWKPRNSPGATASLPSPSSCISTVVTDGDKYINFSDFSMFYKLQVLCFHNTW